MAQEPSALIDGRADATSGPAERRLLAAIGRRTVGYRLFYLAILTLLTIGLVTNLFPLYWMLTNGFKPTAEIYVFPPSLLPNSWDPENFVKAWQVFNFPRYFQNTLVLALGTLMSQISVSSLAAYSLSKLRPVGGRLILFLFLSTLMVPSVAYLIPQFLNVKQLPVLGLNLLNSYWAIWLPAMANAFNIFLFKGFFDGVPNDLLDAAKVDGASAVESFLQILLPLSKPVLAVVMILGFTGSWNDFLWPFLVLQQPERQPITVAVYYLNVADVSWNIVMPVLLLTSLPPVAAALLFQRYIVRGIAVTGLKG